MKNKTKKATTLKLGYGFNFETGNGCLHHPGGYLTSWFREDSKGWHVTEWACYVPPETSIKICEMLVNESFLKGEIHLPLRK